MSRPSPTSPEVAAVGLATAAVAPTEETLNEPTALPQLPKETWRWKLSPQGHSANLYPHRYVRKYFYVVSQSQLEDKIRSFGVMSRRLCSDYFAEVTMTSILTTCSKSVYVAV